MDNRQQLLDKLVKLLKYEALWEAESGGIRMIPTGICIKPHRLHTKVCIEDSIIRVGWREGRQLRKAYKNWFKARNAKLESAATREIEKRLNDCSCFDPQDMVKIRNNGDW